MINRIAVLVGGVVVAVGTLTSCADGPDANAVRAGTTVAPHSTVTEEFCAAVTALDSFLPGPPERKSESDAELERRLDEAARTAPAEVDEAVERLTTGVRSTLDDPERGLLEDEFAANGQVDEFVLEHCAVAQRIEITARDHEFEGIPDKINAGRVAVTFHNKGDEIHMLQFLMVQETRGMTTEEMLAVPPREAWNLSGGPMVLASGGYSDTVLMDLLPGRHIAVDPLPLGTVLPGVSGWGEPHHTRGMFADVTVVATD